MSNQPNSPTRRTVAIVIGMLALLAIGFFATKPTSQGAAPATFLDAPNQGASAAAPDIDASIPSEPEPNVMATPSAPAPNTIPTEHNGTGSLIPVTAMPDSSVYDGLILALATGNTELGRVASSPGTSFEAKACRAYALAATDQPSAADPLIVDLKGNDTDLRQQSFCLVAQAEIAYRRRDTASAGKLFADAVQRASEMPEGTEGAALANLASARFYAATGDESKAKACAEAALKQANTAGERDLAAKYQ